MNPDTIITTLCGKCGGLGKREMKPRHTPGRKEPKKYFPCDECEQTGRIVRSVADRCLKLLLQTNPEFCARRDAPLMAQAAISFAARNEWCPIDEAVRIQWQGREFHTAADIRHRRNKLREECAARGSWRARLTDRNTLMRRIAARRGYANLGDFAAAQYRAGKVSESLYAVMQPSDMARMQYRLGFGGGFGRYQ